MAPVKLETPGAGSVSKSPDVGILFIDIRSQSTDQTKPTWDIQQTAQTIQDELKTLAKKASDGGPAPDAAVRDYQATAMSMRSWLEGNHCHQQHHHHHNMLFRKDEKLFEASMRITAEYADFEKLAKTTAKLASMPFVSVAGVSWRLLNEHQAEARTQAIASACKDALTRARAWADGMGLSEVRVTRIIDTVNSAGYSYGPNDGDLCTEDGDEPGSAYLSRTNEEHILAYAPKNIKVDATCQVHFEIS